MAQLMISAAHKSSGKTTLAIGITAALARRGLVVQTFKKGPDYIDPMWLGAAAGRPCYNLDFNTMAAEAIRSLFYRRAKDAHLALLEGNKGLYDGTARDGSNSNAALAKLLDLPVLLVIDTRGMTRGIAPLLAGYRAFDPAVRFAGVLLNQVGGPRHEAKLRDAVQDYTDLSVLGAVQRSHEIEITERHLGLVPSNEVASARQLIEALAALVAEQVDLDGLLKAASSVPPRDPGGAPAEPLRQAAEGVRIAIARDSAFGFYYADDLEALAAAGAVLVPFDTLSDNALPPVDGLFIGGGFPETHLPALEANASLRASLREAIAAGLPTYAECGGLMYLSRSIEWRGDRRQMVGALPLDILMDSRPVGRGYVRLRETGVAPWAPVGTADAPAEFAAHEFHYSRVRELPAELCFAYEVVRGEGLDGRHDGIVHGNLLASYSHLRNVGQNRWAERFVQFVYRVRQGQRVSPV